MILQATNPEVAIAMYCPVCRTEVSAPLIYDEADDFPFLDLKDVVEVWVIHQGSDECIPYDEKDSNESDLVQHDNQPTSRTED